MSGSLGPIMGGGGVDSSIPLQAGRGAAQTNPLASTGQLVNTLAGINQLKLFPGQMQLQQQSIAQQVQGTLNAQRSGAYGLLAPMLSLPPEQWTHQMATTLLGAGENSGYMTQPVLADMASAPAGDGAAFSAYMRPLIASQMQTGAAERLGSVTPSTVFQQLGNQIQPLSMSAPGGTTQPGTPSAIGSPLAMGPTPGEFAQTRQVLVTPQYAANQGWAANDPRIGSTINVPQGNIPGAFPPQGQDQMLPRGLRNNNPLNLEFQPGQGATSSDGRFGVYPSMAQGIAANVRQLASYQSERGLNTVNAIVGRWAPPGENDTPAYASQVAKLMGVAPGAPINIGDPNTMAKLVNAMGQIENGQMLDPGAVREGVQVGLGGQPRAGYTQGPAGATPSSSPQLQADIPAYLAEKQGTSGLPLQTTRLIEAQDAIRRLSNTDLTTGPGHDLLNKVRTLIGGLGGTPEMEQNAVDAATAEKNLANAIAGQFPRSDAAQQLIQMGTPGLHQPPGASVPLISQLIAANRARQAVVSGANPTGAGFLSYQNQKSNVYNTPGGLAALSYDRMDQSQRVQARKEFGNDPNFQATLREAHQYGLLGQ